jgi:hypothetical protein
MQLQKAQVREYFFDPLLARRAPIHFYRTNGTRPFTAIVIHFTLSRRRLDATACAVCLLLTAIGCGGSGKHPVTGAVSYDGEKVPTGWVTFVGDQGEAPINGAIAEDGTYRLEAEPGVYRVGISAPRKFPEGTKPEDTFRINLPPPHVPPAYNAAERSGLEATVEAKDNVINFALQPIGGGGR